MHFFRIAIFTVALTSIWGVTQATSAGISTSMCDDNKSCVKVEYQLNMEKLLDAPKKMQEQLSIFENIAKDKKLGEIKTDSQSYSVVTNDTYAQFRIGLYGWVVYKLETPEKAAQFISVLQVLQYNATPYEPSTCCC